MHRTQANGPAGIMNQIFRLQELHCTQFIQTPKLVVKTPAGPLQSTSPGLSAIRSPVPPFFRLSLLSFPETPVLSNVMRTGTPSKSGLSRWEAKFGRIIRQEKSEN